jgi:hypothetical protein
MRHYTAASLLSILLFTFHLADDIVRGIEKGTPSNLAALPICAVWLYGTLVLAERRSGYVIVLLGSLLGLGIPIIHMSGSGVGSSVAGSSGALFYIWTLIALGVTALFSLMLAARGLWSRPA